MLQALGVRVVGNGALYILTRTVLDGVVTEVVQQQYLGSQGIHQLDAGRWL